MHWTSALPHLIPAPSLAFSLTRHRCYLFRHELKLSRFKQYFVLISLSSVSCRQDYLDHLARHVDN